MKGEAKLSCDPCMSTVLVDKLKKLVTVWKLC